MDKKELREKTIKALEEIVEEKTQEYQKKYLEMRMGQEDDVHSPRKLRKEIALIKTIIREKQLDKLNNGKDE